MKELTKDHADQYPMVEYCVVAVEFDNGRTAGVHPFLFTWAIVSDFDRAGYGDRWCYHTLQDALAAFQDWDGEGEPQGWHRHPDTGRRVDENGQQYIMP